MIRTVKIVVAGHVQGVFFRKFTKHKADGMGVFGTVRNRDDGCVEIIAQAEADALEPFIEWCRKGPVTARVDAVEVQQLTDAEKNYRAFEII